MGPSKGKQFNQYLKKKHVPTLSLHMKHVFFRIRRHDACDSPISHHNLMLMKITKNIYGFLFLLLCVLDFSQSEEWECHLPSPMGGKSSETDLFLRLHYYYYYYNAII